MAFRIILSEEMLLELEKLDNKAAKRILDRLEHASENPMHFFQRLVGREDYRLRIGDYRIIARIIQDEKMIFVDTIGHRKNVYKRMDKKF